MSLIDENGEEVSSLFQCDFCTELATEECENCGELFTCESHYEDSGMICDQCKD